jgi:ribulose-phosphate 3-epimerase
VNHLHRTIHLIRDKGVRPGVALNPATPLGVVEYVLGQLDMVVLMTVNPGFEAQKFIPEVIPKIRSLRKMVNDLNLSLEIEVDGGIDPENIGRVSSAGADVFVAGSAIYYSKDYKETISLMRERMSEAE